MRSPLATSPPTTRRRFRMTLTGLRRSWRASRPGAGAGQTTSPEPPSFSPPRRPTTSPASSCRSMAGGSGARACARPVLAVREPELRNRLLVHLGAVAGRTGQAVCPTGHDAGFDEVLVQVIDV